VPPSLAAIATSITLTAVVGCLPFAEEIQTDEANTRADDGVITSNKNVVPVANRSMLPFAGYNEITANVTGACVTPKIGTLVGNIRAHLPAILRRQIDEPKPGQPVVRIPDPAEIPRDRPAFLVSGVEGSTDFEETTSTRELARKLGVNSDFGAAYRVVEVAGKLQFESDETAKNDAYYVLLKVKASYAVVRLNEVEFAKDKESLNINWLAFGGPEWAPEEFLHGCGHVYASGIMLGAHLNVLYELHLDDNSATKRREVLTAFTAGIPIGAELKANAGVQDKLKSALTGVRGKVHLDLAGFTRTDKEKQKDPGRTKFSVKAMLEKFDLAQVDTVLQDMFQSVAKDREADDKDFYAGGKNTTVVTEAFFPDFYTELLPSKFKRVPAASAIVKLLRDFVRSYKAMKQLDSDVQTRHAEIKELFRTNHPEFFNRAPPARAETAPTNVPGIHAALTMVEHFRGRAMPYLSLFDVEGPGSPANLHSVALQQCWDQASIANFTPCGWKDGHPPDPSYLPLWGRLRRYDTDVRVVQLIGSNATGPASAWKGDRGTYEKAALDCQERGMNLATPAHLEGLALLLQTVGEFWLYDPYTCNNLPAHAVLFNGRAQVSCAPNRGEKPYVCVSKDGLRPPSEL
jgi:hypothetical protein